MLIEPRLPIYDWGQEVLAAVDLYNDGSLPGAEADALLVAAGGPGEIVQVGHHNEANLPLYMVDFGTCVLGCFEEELVRPDAAAARPGVAAGAAGANLPPSLPSPTAAALPTDGAAA